MEQTEGGGEAPASKDDRERRSGPDAGRAGRKRDKSGRRAPRLKHPQSLERLRDRVETAAHEIERLRRENRQLAESLKVLWSKASGKQAGTYVAFDESPDAIRKKVEGFITAIDRYLENNVETE